MVGVRRFEPPVPASRSNSGTCGIWINSLMDMMEIEAGSVVVFSALTLHGSGLNSTEKPRRALNIAYSQSVLPDNDGQYPYIDFIVDGKLTDAAASLRY